LSYWPSPAGVACVNYTSGATTLYNWAGSVTAGTGPPISNGTAFSQSGISPKGSSVFFSTGVGIGAPSPATQILQLGPGPYAQLPGDIACVWIDEDHLLSPRGVIGFAAETPGNVQVNTTFTAFAAPGICGGRFPGGL